MTDPSDLGQLMREAVSRVHPEPPPLTRLRAVYRRRCQRRLVAGGVTLALVLSGVGWSVASGLSGSGRQGVRVEPAGPGASSVPPATTPSSISALSPWSKPVPINAGYNGAYWSVSCPTQRFCAAVASTNVVTYNGLAWSPPVSIISNPQSLGAAGISCPTSTFCALVDTNGYAFTYNGRSWSRPVNVERYPQDQGGFSANHVISCPTSTYCVAVDMFGDVVIYNAGEWHKATPIGGPVPGSVIGGEVEVDSISCPTTRSCVAVDGRGNAFTYNGTTWSHATNFDRTHPAQGIETTISCPTTLFCTVVDSNGNASTFNGVTWSKTINFDPGPKPGYSLDAVSCPTTRFCVAVDGAGNAFTYNGSAWSKPLHMDSDVGGQPSVSCPTDRFCLATDGQNALTYH